ncbi:MAG: hypothetical protein M3121_01985 [Chloroflexota bacterium]|nr:hypothetical protein [Chloroflexota bacterium]
MDLWCWMWEHPWLIGGFALLVVTVWFGAVAIFFGDDDSVAALVGALLMATPLTIQFLTGNDDSLFGLLVLLPGAVWGGLVLHSWWWPVLCPLPTLGVAALSVWYEETRPPGQTGLDPMPELRLGVEGVMVFAGEAVLAALVIAGLAALGVALGRRL